MRKKIILAIVIFVMVIATTESVSECKNESTFVLQTKGARAWPIPIPNLEQMKIDAANTVVVTTPDIAEEEYFDGLDVLASLVWAEAGNQPFEGKVKVAKIPL